MSDETTTPKKQTKKQPEVFTVKNKWKPTFKGTVDFVSHLFKLTDAKLKRKIILGQNSDSIQDATHNHFFHTIDSSGKVMEHSMSVGGHFHVMTVTNDPETGEPKAVCSGPKTFAFRKNRKVIVDLPSLGDDENGNPIIDNHVHQVAYMGSSRLRPRTLNAESASILNQEANKTTPVPGVS